MTFSRKSHIIPPSTTNTLTNMKTKKVEIWLNGRFFAIAKNQVAAEREIARNQRQDAYERSIGYFVPECVYEIRPYSNQH